MLPPAPAQTCHSVAVAAQDTPARHSTSSVRALAEQWARFGRDPDVVEVVALLRSVTLVVTEVGDAVLARHGLNRGRFDVLAALYRAGADSHLTQAELADQMLLTPAGVKKRLDALVGAGFVARDLDTRDARRQPLSLTPAGVAQVERVLDGFFAAEAAAVAPLSARQRADLVRLLRLLLAD